MTAAAAWEAAGDALPPEITRILDSSREPFLVGQKLLLAIPEWQVALRGGTTNSSTDVLAICRNDFGLCILGVEAKVLEDFGPLVSSKRTDASAGQSERLAYLHSLLRVERFDDAFAINSCIALHPRFSQQGSSTLARLSCWCRHSIRQSHNARTSRRSELRLAQGRLRRSLTRWIRSVDPVCIWPGAMATSISETWCCQARPSSLLKSPVQCFDQRLEGDL